jgi:hypothetical protein
MLSTSLKGDDVGKFTRSSGNATHNTRAFVPIMNLRALRLRKDC